jgi:hypothetical protein
MYDNAVKIAGATLTNVLGESRLTLPRGDVLTDPNAILTWLHKRLMRSQMEAKQRRESRIATMGP